MRERLRRWLCAPSEPVEFHLLCNHCDHADDYDSRQLTVQVSDQRPRWFLAGRCRWCGQVVAIQITNDLADKALMGGAKHVHVVEAKPIREKDIARFVRSMDDHLADLLT